MDANSGREPRQASLIRRLLPVCVWLIVALIFAAQLHLFASRAGGKMSWRDALIWEMPRWILWMLLAPLVARIARAYPVGKQQTARRIVFHLCCAVAFSLAHLLLFVLIFHGLRLMFGNQGSLLDTFTFAFTLDFHVGVAVYGLIVLLRQSSDSEKRLSLLQSELMHAQLQALKMQLHPHFLFNTLNSISSYLRTDIEIADEMIGRLGDFLRLTLQTPGTQEIVLEKELDFLKRYLDIEQLRFQERLETRFEIDPAALPALVPNFILQPVVENAVRHGVSRRPGIAVIRIAARQQNGHLQITVHDNGPGLPETLTEGIGISTTRNRLRQLYGDDAQFTLSNHPDGGALVTLGIPFHLSERAV